MHFPEFQGSGLTQAEFPQTFSPLRDSAEQPRCFLLNTNAVCAAKILIYEFSSDELLKRKLSGSREVSSAVKQMLGKSFLL